MSGAIAVLIAFASAYLVAVFVVLFITVWRGATLGRVQGDLLRTYSALEGASRLPQKLGKYGADICDRDDIPQQYEDVQQAVDKQLSKIEAPDESLLKIMVNIIHQPMDLREDSFLAGDIDLLSKGFCMLWVYSKQCEPADFPSALKAALQRRGLKAADLERCEFVELGNFEDLPINCSVVSPLDNGFTVTYVFFPNDEYRDLTVKLTRPTLLAGRLDALAVKCLWRALKGKPNLPACWQAIRDEIDNAGMAGGTA